ncbi:MAG: Gfo/Idh/MocA family oxidoreductase, partial [Nitrospinota bacterium]
GRMGEYHTAVYSELFFIDLVGIVDIKEERGKTISKQFNTACFYDFHEILDKVDAVSIAVPTGLHYTIAKEFLSAGVNVLLEKPITNNFNQAVELFGLAEKNNCTLHIGHVERFNGAVQELKKIVHEPLLIESRRLSPFQTRIEDDGVVMDLMIHDIDIILNLVESEILDINVMGRSYFTGKDDLASVQIQFKNNCVANIIASRVTQDKIRTMAISQKDAYIYLDFTDQEIHIHREASSEHRLGKHELHYKQESFTERLFVHRENPLKLEIKHFLDCSTNDAASSISVDKELRSLKVALEIVDKFNKSQVNL